MGFREPPRLCVLIPVFNHPRTIHAVVAGVAQFYPVIVVDDGSTDSTPQVLATSPARVVTLPVNVGKGAALRAGFQTAKELGFTHVITMDADGQHPSDALPDFAQACCENPRALVVGVRDLRQARAPLVRRFSNWLSASVFRLETGHALADSQCGMRGYPLAEILPLPVTASRYAYELEVLVRACWAQIPVVPCPVQADYLAPTSRLSHFHPLRDFAHICGLHARLLAEAILLMRRCRR